MLKTKSFAQNKLFGLFLASSLFFTSSLYAQNPLPTCTPFCFEICKVLPTPNLFPSTPTNPSAFQAYYKVKLKVLPNNPNILMLPLSWNFNYLAFSGKLSVNGFTSRIDVEQTKIFSQSSGGMINPFYGPPTAPYLNVTEDGDVTWILGNIGNTGNCTGGEPGITLNFPPGQSEITLFTIVVEGVSGDIINFIDLSAEVKDCNTYGCPNGSIPIIGCQGQNNYLVSFPIQTCNPDKSISFEMVQLQNNSLIAVYLNNSPIGGVIKQCDMVIHILPQMNSINNLKLKAIEINGGPIIKRKETIENNDGSWDIYVVIGGFTAVNPKVALFGISIEGVINLSQGAHFICSMSPGRGVFPAGGGASVVCALTSTMAELVLPGYGPCANMLKLSATRYIGSNCSLGAKFTITHDLPNSNLLNLSLLKFLLIFDLSTNNSPGTISTTLPCPSCGTLSFNASTGFWEYLYEQSSPLQLLSGAEIIVPFDINNDCIRYYVVFAEAEQAGAKCALAVNFDTNQWPVCDPSVHGAVKINHPASTEPAPYYKVTLESQTDPNYEIITSDDCEVEYSFCPDVTKTPFKLRAEMESPNYLCGVTTYDMVLITKHMLGIQLLSYPLGYIAADALANTNPFLIDKFDVERIKHRIQGINPDYGPGGAPSWWYFRDNYPFNSPSPLSPPYIGSNITDVPLNGAAGGTYGNFFAVKVGDVNQSCLCYTGKPSGLNNAKVYLKTSSLVDRRTPNLIYVPVFLAADFDLIAVQTGVRFDPLEYSLDFLRKC